MTAHFAIAARVQARSNCCARVPPKAALGARPRMKVLIGDLDRQR